MSRITDNLIIRRIACVILTISSLAIFIVLMAGLLAMSGISEIEHMQVSAVEDLTKSTIIDIQRQGRSGLALTLDGQVCVLESSSVACIDDFHQAIAIHYSDGYYLIMTEDGTILSLYDNNPQGTINYALEVFFKHQKIINSFQQVGIFGCCDLVELGHPVAITAFVNNVDAVVEVN